MADPTRAGNLSMWVVGVVTTAGLTACTQSMPLPPKGSLTPASSGTSAVGSTTTTTTTTTAATTTTTTAPTSATDATTSSTSASSSTSTSSTASSSSSSTSTTSTSDVPAPQVIVGQSVLTAKGPVQCTDDANGIRTIKVGSGTVYTAQVTTDENFTVVKMDLGVVDGVPMQVHTNGGSVPVQGRKSGNSYSIVGTAQGTDPSTKQVVKKDFKFEATCP